MKRASRNRLPRLAPRCLLLGMVQTSVWAQPAHDAFADRLTLAGAPVEVASSNEGASVEPGEPESITAIAAGSVWWKWIPSESAHVTFSTRGSTFDTFLGVFIGDSLAALDPIAINDDEDLLGGIFTSRVTFFARQNTPYQIVVAGLASPPDLFDSGDIQLNIGPTVPEPLPAWEILTLDGERIDSSALPGRFVIVDFWATWCNPCRAEIPTFINLRNRYGDDGLVILGISVDTTRTAAVRTFANELGMNYPIAMTTAALERAFGGVPSIPTAIILDAKNNLIDRHIGFRDEAFWEASVKALLDTGPDPVALKGLFSGDHLQLSWPATASPWTLQSAEHPVGRWSDVLATPETEEGTVFLTLSTTNAPARFFRLVQP